MIKAGGQAALSGGTLRGASTITQQVMKNFILDSSRTVERKVKELILASRLEKTLSKDRILELYLNEIFLGAELLRGGRRRADLFQQNPRRACPA